VYLRDKKTNDIKYLQINLEGSETTDEEDVSDYSSDEDDFLFLEEAERVVPIKWTSDGIPMSTKLEGRFFSMIRRNTFLSLEKRLQLEIQDGLAQLSNFEKQRKILKREYKTIKKDRNEKNRIERLNVFFIKLKRSTKGNKSNKRYYS
jgi:hypothetical protein